MDIQRSIPYSLSLALTTVFLLHLTGILSIPFLDTLENIAYDTRLKLLLAEPRDRQVVIIDIDENSLAEIGRWPWNRGVMADINDKLFDHYQIKAIGYDTVFAEADEDQAVGLLRQMADGPLGKDQSFQLEYARAMNALHYDKQFANSLAHRKTILGFVMETDTQKGMLPEPAVALDSSLNGRIPFISPRSYTANLDMLQASASSGGFFDNPLLDGDGVFRRIPLLQEFDGNLYESLALALVRTTLGSAKLELVVESSPDNTNELLLQWLKVGDILIPVDQHAAILIPYRGKQKSFTYIPAIDVLNKSIPVEYLIGKIALFGASAPGLQDLVTTPLEAAFPGVEIHANIVQGILDQAVLHKPGYTVAFEFLLILLLGLSLTFVLPQLSPGWGLIASTSIMLLLITVNLAIWRNLQLVLPLSSPVLLTIILFGLHMTYGFFVETRSKRKLTHLFGQYVPPELVDKMSTKMEAINLDGESREMSVLFSDVRDFTSISESMTAEQLTRLINAFLTPITAAIEHQRGTIDKYMGDAVMAFWGAPIEDPQHALHAVTAAMDIVNRIDELKPRFQSRGWPEIKMGIGINSGEMNVGNKGTESRVDYTVVGDAVNLGSRLESLTKVYGVDIITGETTRHAVPEVEFRELDLVRVKGKDRPVAIYEPMGLLESIDESAHTELAQFHLALKHYRTRRWDDAEREFSDLCQADPQRKIYQVYLERIIHFRIQPPADDWDGSFTHTSK